jgi:hypothetical protein
MKKKLLLSLFILQVILLVLVSSAAIAQEIRTYTLKDIGFQKDIVLYGITPAQTFFFPIPRSGVDFSNSYFELHYSFSSILSEYSNIKVSIDDVPVYTSFYKSAVTSPVVRISLAAVGQTDLLELEKPLLKIEVGGYLNITDDRCRDLATQALWLVIRQESKLALSFPTDVSKNFIADFFSSRMENNLFLVPKVLDPQIAGATMWINTRILEDVKASTINYDSFEEFDINKLGMFTHIVCVGKVDNLMSLPIPLAISREAIKEQFKQDLASDDGILLTKTFGRTKVLYVTGETSNAVQKASGTLVNPKNYAKLLSNFAVIRYIEPFKIKSFKDNKYKLTLDELGYERLQTKGIGSLRITIYFSELDLAKSLDNVDFYLYSKYTPVKETFPNGFLNIYLNDVLVESKRLDASGAFNGLYVSLPKYLFKKVNNCDIEFNYFPDEGECKDDLTQFVGEIYSYSYFDISTGIPEKVSNFNKFPNSFLLNTYVVFQANPLLQHIKAASSIIRSIQTLSRQTQYYPPAMSFAEMFNTMENSNNNYIVVSSDVRYNKESFEYLPLDMNQRFKIISSTTKQVMFEYSDDMPIAVMQLTRTLTNNQVLLLSSFGDQGRNYLIQLADYFSQRISHVDGNVAILSGTEYPLFFKTTEAIDKILYTTKERVPIEISWDKYKYVMLLIGWIIIIGISILLYIRSRRGVRIARS